jgi:non-homologous end joining protein Ku
MPALGHVYWRGFLRLQLVSINVDVYAATESASEIQFNQIHKPSGKRIRYDAVELRQLVAFLFVIGLFWLVLKSG